MSVRLHQLSKEIKMENKELIELLKSRGFEVKSASSTIDNISAEWIKKSKNNREVEITFDVPGVYFYQCTPHKAMGMIAIVVVGDDTSNKDTILKASKAKGKSKKKLKKLLENL